jgi:Ser/Thr protein kinase RdoA (MazF antagonist)
MSSIRFSAGRLQRKPASTTAEQTEHRDIIVEGDIVRFLADQGCLASEITPYTDGVASRNFRAIGPADLDLTVRCDFRRPLDKVREDRMYADLASLRGISVPRGPWIDGHIRSVAATARPTIAGVSLAQLEAFQLPEPSRIGEMLAALHKSAPASADRRFFYAGLLDSSDPLWESFSHARAAFRHHPGLSELIERATARLERGASRLLATTDMPRCMIHGDFNPPNILASGEELILIDWEKACAGYAIADLVQAIYYFSAWYGRHGLPFAAAFMQRYRKTHDVRPSILDAWLSCFPAFIFLRDTVSASLQPLGPVGRMQLARFQAYLRNDSAPRFRYFVENEPAIRHAVLG